MMHTFVCRMFAIKSHNLHLSGSLSFTLFYIAILPIKWNILICCDAPWLKRPTVWVSTKVPSLRQGPFWEVLKVSVAMFHCLRRIPSVTRHSCDCCVPFPSILPRCRQVAICKLIEIFQRRLTLFCHLNTV
jgi:hypothetical protein